jgi:broad specificity phosphatase PhoE
VYSSPLHRAIQTAQILAAKLELIEPSFDAEGLTRSSNARTYPEGVPGMESPFVAAMRAELILRGPDNRSIAVTHAGVIKGLAGLELRSMGFVRHRERHSKYPVELRRDVERDRPRFAPNWRHGNLVGLPA